ncbi:MAG: ABC transporter substrate-binding protein [Chloroflexi bacterium]|nr:ABC transporter substrate-binding protein [Chloroflexota bacterium]MDA8219935.1 ABC transporter substrate-binding protein [Dehalococcoidales bacterium]
MRIPKFLSKSMTRRELLVALGATGAAAVAAGCTTSAVTPAAAPQATQAPKPAATAAPAAAGTGPAPKFAYKIGMVAPLTGDVKTFGESTKNGIDLMVAEANARGAKVTVVTADDKNDPTEGVNAANKLITQDGVKALVGSVSSKVSIPISDVAQSNKVIMITGTSTNPSVTVADGKRKDYVFRACFIDPFQGTVMAKFALDNLKAKKAAVLYDNSNDYTKGLAEFFRDGFKAGGGTINVFESYGKDDKDFSALLTKVAADKPDFLFLPDYYNKVNLIAAQARQVGIAAVFGGGDGWDSSDLDTKATEGGYFSNHYSPDDQGATVQNFVKNYKAKYNAVPDALAALAYDATTLLLTAAEKAGSDDPTKVRDAMAGLSGVQTVSGKITFDKNGDPTKAAVVLQIKGGKQTYVATVQP